MSLPKNSEDIVNIVSEYLKTHPNFFIDHPDLLTNIHIPHKPGKNVASLIEVQVARLRHANQYLQEHFDDMQLMTEQEQRLTGIVHTECLELLRSDTIGQLYDRTYLLLKKSFNAKSFMVFIFAESRLAKDYRGLHMRKSGSKLQRLFTELFTRNKSLCDSLQEELIIALFGEKTFISSTLLLPIKQDKFTALVALGSDKTNTYKQGYQLQLLEFVIGLFIQQFEELIHQDNV